MPPWRAFVINLNNDHDRWSFVQQQLVAAEVPYTRISGVDGEALKFPLAEVSERSLKYLHGRYPSKPEVGCYLSHIKAIEAFLDSDLDYGLILEDDVALPNDLGGIVDAAIEFRDDWDILRLSSVNSGRKFRVADLGGGRFLGVCFTREKGAGAYLLNRKAARVFRSRLLPMRFAYDIAFDLYFVGLNALMVVPLPVLQGHGLHPVLPGHGSPRGLSTPSPNGRLGGISPCFRSAPRSKCLASSRACSPMSGCALNTPFGLAPPNAPAPRAGERTS